MSLFFQTGRKATFMENVLAPALGIIAILVVDHSVSSVLLTPTLSICLLGLLAFRLETRILTFWFIVIWLSVVLSFITNPGGKGGMEMNLQTIIVRSLGFAVSGSIAVVMNRGRAKLGRNQRYLLDMLERLPCAVTVSDSEGKVLFANQRILSMLGKPASEVMGLSFFTFFTPPEHQGHEIQAYLRLAEGAESREVKLTVMRAADRREEVTATQIPMNLVGNKCIVTVIDFNVATRKVAESLLAQMPA